MEENTIEKEELIDVSEIEPDDLAVTIETKVRTALFFIVWLNQIFAFVGAPTLDLDFDGVYAVVSSIVTFAVSGWAWWKNNSFTKHALIGDVAKEAAKHAKQ